MKALILRLEGPLMTFGDVAVDERMPTARFPGLSMICGLLANAIGLRRTDGAAIQSLQDRMAIASRLDRAGHLLDDFQTARLGKGDRMWTSSGKLASRDGGANTYDNPVIIRRQYWADASVTVAITLPEEEVARLADSLATPSRPLFLGRVCCPPSSDILRDVVDCQDAFDALLSVPTESEGPSHLLAQWPAHLEIDVARSREVLVSDVKDWLNNIHRGDRLVREGMIAFPGMTAEPARLAG